MTVYDYMHVDDATFTELCLYVCIVMEVLRFKMFNCSWTELIVLSKISNSFGT